MNFFSSVQKINAAFPRDRAEKPGTFLPTSTFVQLQVLPLVTSN